MCANNLIRFYDDILFLSQLINALIAHHCITGAPERGLGSYRSRFAQGPWELCDEPFATEPKLQVGFHGFLKSSTKVPPQKNVYLNLQSINYPKLWALAGQSVSIHARTIT